MCDHPNIVRLYNVLAPIESFCNPEENDEVVNIVMEMCDAGDIEGFFEKNYKDQPLPDEYIQHFLEGLVKGLSYLHKFPVYHRDLKLGNILLKNDPTRPGKPIVKISDFGMSKHVEGDFTQTFAGTPVFMAP